MLCIHLGIHRVLMTVIILKLVFHSSLLLSLCSIKFEYKTLEEFSQ